MTSPLLATWAAIASASRAAIAASQRAMFANAAPGDRRLQVVAGERLAVVAQRFGFRGPTLCQEGATEQRRGARRIDAEAVGAQAVVRRAQTLLRRGGVPLDQLDEPGEHLG